ncbi:hypothetical protein CFC21_068689 [Triticum aestivum]|uniref:ELM2 domain-containing protein n=2 Tax=Triticum aestivum TaxID=4565 RepID=A0A3B6KSX1_WHEAT|nr:uncharacterized protein LOC123105735 [Triticum aestivum]KAF7062046.1 hypothetical protein CFC21_068689 [Triticum aestivum]
MAGSDLPYTGSVGGGIFPPPRTPPSASRKRRRGDNDDGAPPSLPSRETRASVAAREAAVGAVRTARRVAAGAVWAAKAGRGHGRGLGNVGRMREVLLTVRGARCARVRNDDDDDDYPYPQESRSPERLNCKISYLSNYPLKRVRTDPVKHQASVPEWKNAPSVEYTDDYKAATLPKLGTVVYPLNMDISATDKSEKKRKRLVDKCKCSCPGSEDCVRFHVKKARSWIKDQLGEEAFKNCGLDAMGEQVGEQWTTVFKRKLEKVDKLIPQNKHQKFMEIALKELGQKETKDLAKYYYNVFLPRRLASLTRAEHKKDEAVDTSDEKSDQEDGENERHPRKKSKKSYGSSSTRCKK